MPVENCEFSGAFGGMVKTLFARCVVALNVFVCKFLTRRRPVRRNLQPRRWCSVVVGNKVCSKRKKKGWKNCWRWWNALTVCCLSQGEKGDTGPIGAAGPQGAAVSSCRSYMLPRDTMFGVLTLYVRVCSHMSPVNWAYSKQTPFKCSWIF